MGRCGRLDVRFSLEQVGSKHPPLFVLVLCSVPIGRLARARKKPGEKKTMKFELERDVLAIRNVHNEFAAEPAEVTVWIRPDSAHGSEALLQILP